MVQKYRKKPVVIEAILWDGNNYAEIIRWSKLKPHQLLHGSKAPINAPDWKLTIPTLEGNITADLGDYIIKGIKGEFYPCKPDIFEATYEDASTPLLTKEHIIKILAEANNQAAPFTYIKKEVEKL